MVRWLHRWRELRGALATGTGRFPVAVAALATFAVEVNLVIAEAISETDTEILRSGIALVGAAAIATAVALFGERRGLGALPRHLLSLVLGAIVGLALWYWERLAVAFPALFVASLLTIPLAPYLRRERGGFWAFIWRLIHALALAFVAVIVFCLGLSAILASIDYLFGIAIESSIYGHIWSIGLGFVGPVFALSLIPESFSSDDRPDSSDVFVAGIRLLSDFVAVPLILAYVIVLHVYALKVLIELALPKGQIGWMVLFFGLAVLTLRIVVHPMAAIARPPTRLFLVYWPLGLIVPLVLLLIAVWQRIGEYGVTPERYALALFALFLGLVLLAQISRPTRGDIRLIPALGALALFVTCFGPWGMFSVSASSQLERLRDALAEAGALENGRLAEAPDLSHGAANDVRSIVAMLDEIGQLDRLRPIFAGRDDDPFVLPDGTDEEHRERLKQIREVLNVEVLPPSPVGNFVIAGSSGAAAIGGFDVIVPGLVLRGDMVTPVSLGGTTLRVRTELDTIVIVSDDAELRIEPDALREAFRTRVETVETRPETERSPFLVDVELRGKRVGLLFQRVTGNVTETSLTLSSGSFDLLLRRADWTGASGGE